MIRAALREGEGELTLRLRGHAYAAPPGQDLVCAAASALAWAAAGYAEALSARGALARTPKIALEKGRAEIRLEATPDAADELSGAAGLLCAGFTRLSAAFPGNIRFTVVSKQTPNMPSSGREETDKI